MAEDSSIEGKLVGRGVVDPHGYKIGTIDALYVHGDSEVPNWARVKVGILRADFALIPLQDAQEDGDDVRLVYEKEHVKAAPEVEPDGEELSDEDADKLHSHYGLERVLGLTAEGSEDEMELPRETRDAKPPGMEEGPDSPLSQRRRQRQEEIEEVARDFEQTKQGESPDEAKGETRDEAQGETQDEDQGETRDEDQGETRDEDQGETRDEDQGETRDEDQGETRDEGQGETRDEEQHKVPDTKQRESTEQGDGTR
jgi:hypothetical protein